MIKTQQFNDFTEYHNYTLTSTEEKEQFFQALLDFQKQGGNLELPVMHNDSSALTPPEEYFRKVFDDANYVSRMIEHGMLSSPFSFRIDEANNTIWTSQIFGIQKMAQSAIMDMYEKQILKAIEVLVENLQHCAKEPDILQTWSEYDNKYEQRSFKHPVLTILSTFDKPEIYDIVFSKRPDYKNLFLETSEGFKKAGKTGEEKIKEMIVGYQGDINKEELAIVFYKHGMADFIHQPGNEKMLFSLLQHMATNGYVELLEQFFPDIDLRPIELDSNDYYSLLYKVHDYDTAKWLLDHHAFVIGERHIVSGSIDETKETSIFHDELSAEAFEAVLDHPDYQHLVEEHGDSFFKTYGDRRFNSKHIMLLVDKYHASLNNVDAMSLGLSIQKTFNLENPEKNGVQWMLDHGADPRNCAQFISTLISDRKEGLPMLKRLHKSKTFNAHYPDPVFHMLDKSDVKHFFTYLEKIPDEAFSLYTKKGYPAWWGAKKGQAITVIKDKKIDFNQTAQTGVSYYTFLASRTERVYKTMEDIVKILTKQDPDAKLKMGKPNALGNNFFHNLYSVKTTKLLDTELVPFFIAHSDTPTYELLFQPNFSGITPVDQILQAHELNQKKSSNGMNGSYLGNIQFDVSAFINDIVSHIDEIDFHQEVKPGVSILEQTRSLLKIYTWNKQNSTIPLDKLFETAYLTDKLDKELPENEEPVSSSKMKI
jgi:hypothetical protein